MLIVDSIRAMDAVVSATLNTTATIAPRIITTNATTALRASALLQVSVTSALAETIADTEKRTGKSYQQLSTELDALF